MIHRLTLLLLLAALPACKRLDEKMEIAETRELSTFASPVEAGATSDQRFMPALRAFDLLPKEKPAAPMDFRKLLKWDLPTGWAESETPDATGMRLVDVRFGPAKEGECYISLMAGEAGGLNANINRWRKQMGQPAYTDDEIAKLPMKPFFNREGTFVSVDGDYTAVGAPLAKKDYRLLGIIHSAPQATIFVKLIGPKALVEQNAAAFDAFCQSVRSNLPDSQN
jgi:hypothetical protein